MSDFAGWAAIIWALFAAGFGIYGAFFVEVRNNQDLFIQDLQKQSRVASLAAALAALSALAQVAERLLK